MIKKRPLWLMWLIFSGLIVYNCRASRVLPTVPIAEIDPRKSQKIDLKDKSPSLNEVRDSMIQHKKYVFSDILDNGMTILVRPVHTIPKVSIQLWYNVGSKDETDGERGIAHLIEHMIFKGTKKLSESDINVVTHMLSGNTNAFTSYDYTGYLFNIPTHHWKQALPIMADCMENCTFKEDMLNSEMKAVIQELKKYRDSYVRNLIDEKISLIFSDHPYHHPIIGYKQDLWSVSGEDLKSFYQKHYSPNNATLVIVGDVQPQDVFDEARKHFGHLKPDKEYKKAEFYFNQDIVAKSVTFYRDVKQPTVILSFVIPGSHQKKDHLISLAEIILGSGKSSRLYKKIVNELQLATSLDVGAVELFDHSLFCVAFEPKKMEDVEAIETHIQRELEKIAKEGITDQELTRAIKQRKMYMFDLLENNEHQAYEIGKYFLATGDPDYVFNYLNYPKDELKQGVQELIAHYLRPAIMHKGMILPLPENEREQWAKLQASSDEQDKKILSTRERNTPVEPPFYAKTIEVKKPGEFDFPKAQVLKLSNGMKALYHHNDNMPKIDIVIEFAARSYYDPESKPGLYNFVAKMLTEGTQKYTAQELADIVESRGISLNVYAGGVSMSMLAEDFEFGLQILHEILTSAIFDKGEMEKVRAQILAQIKNFWDEPSSFSNQLIRQELYKGHPYSKNLLGTNESIESISQEDLVAFYQKYITPQGSKIAIVGDLNNYDIQSVLDKNLSSWQKAPIEPIDFPILEGQKVFKEINYTINRDQVVLCFAGLSVARKHPDFDKLMLFDQIFGGGVLGSMSSRLFQLREQSGLFYGINGSLVVGADEQPGMFLVKTIVSLDRLQEAEKVIKETINATADTITPQEFSEAKNAIANTLVNNFSSTSRTARAFLYLDRYDFPSSFFDNWVNQLEKITLADVQQAAKKVMQSALLTLRVGRVPEQKATTRSS